MMRYPRRLLVEDVKAAAEWYGRVFAGIVEAVHGDRARVALGEDGVELALEKGTPRPHPTTPVLELCVGDLSPWLEAALAGGATRATPEALQGYAQFRDPYGYLWALRERPEGKPAP